MPKIYVGERNKDKTLSVYTRLDENGQLRLRNLNPRFDLRNHSPTGFESGYSGSGPAQLALAICADVLGDDEKAQTVYQGFKAACVAKLPRDAHWELTEAQVLETINTLTDGSEG